MRVLRWVFVLFLSVALDAAPPLVSNAVEASESMEEEVRPGRHRRGLRRVPTTAAAPVPHEALARMVRRSQTVHPAPAAPTTLASRVRKLPPSATDSASVPEDQ
jgi:hypothetical protein